MWQLVFNLERSFWSSSSCIFTIHLMFLQMMAKLTKENSLFDQCQQIYKRIADSKADKEYRLTAVLMWAKCLFRKGLVTTGELYPVAEEKCALVDFLG